jgi:hypothetical protein
VGVYEIQRGNMKRNHVFTMKSIYFGTAALVVALFWMINPQAWIADDSYFYLVIARNMALTGSQTFSGIIPTNGAHPLWLWLLSGWAQIVHIISPELLLTPHTYVLLVCSIWLGFFVLFVKLAAKLALPLEAVAIVLFFNG